MPGQDEIQKYVNKLGKVFHDIKILLTGYQVVGQGVDLPQNAEVIMNVSQLVQLAEAKN